MKYKRRFEWFCSNKPDVNREGIDRIWEPSDYEGENCVVVERHVDDGKWYIGPDFWLNPGHRCEPPKLGPFSSLDEVIQVWELMEGLKQFPDFREVKAD